MPPDFSWQAVLDKHLLIQWRIENGTKQMQIVNSDDGSPLPIPQVPLPNNIVGFRRITIAYIDQNVITFLGRFRRLFPVSSINLDIVTENLRIVEFVLFTIWPMLGNSICLLELNKIVLHGLRQLAPSILCDSPALLYTTVDRVMPFVFPLGDNANASDDQALTKWLLTPRPDGVPKLLNCNVNSVGENWFAAMDELQNAFRIASSPVSFRVFLGFPKRQIDIAVPFELNNEVTGEELTLRQIVPRHFVLTRCPIGWDHRNWQIVSALINARPNPIDIVIKDGEFDERLLNTPSPAPGGQQQQ